MPKKTKREKIMARERRQKMIGLNAPQNNNTDLPQAHHHESNAPVFRFQAQDTPAQQRSLSIAPSELSLIRRDLTKTFILAVTAICIEIALSHVLK